MGNRSSSVQPAGPPPLLSAAVLGDWTKFQEAWDGEESLQVMDRQENNVLHALFSCRGRPNAQCKEILDKIHTCSTVMDSYKARNQLGCTPLWILVAYGNVELLKEVQTKIDSKESFVEMLLVPNDQGDSPFLATCSQGNLEMVRYLKEETMTPEQFTNALSQANEKGTTPLQIVVGNNHVELLKYLLQQEDDSLKEQLMQKNLAGLSLFHVASERNAHEILQVLLLDKSDDKKTDLEPIFALKDKNGATALHVAAFCGNQETVQVWIDVAHKAFDDKIRQIELLDKMDNQARTAYWLAMVQGREAIGQLLAETGVDTKHPNMLKEIEEAKQQREERAAARQAMRPNVDGSALLGR